MTRTRNRLQAEIQQTRPFRSPQQEGLISIFRTADLLRRAMALHVEPHGISGQQFNVLRILRGATPERLPTLTIARRMIEQTPGITRLLDRLERKALVQRERCPSDRRRVLCSITPGGLALLGELDPLVARAEDEVLGAISGAELQTLLGILDAIRRRHA